MTDLFAGPIPDFDWGPARRRDRYAALRDALLVVVGAVAIVFGLGALAHDAVPSGRPTTPAVSPAPVEAPDSLPDTADRATVSPVAAVTPGRPPDSAD